MTTTTETVESDVVTFRFTREFTLTLDRALVPEGIAPLVEVGLTNGETARAAESALNDQLDRMVLEANEGGSYLLLARADDQSNPYDDGKAV